MLKQNLQQKLLQKLSPQQIQLIKLLELPTVQLEQRIKKELEENPTLEEGRNNEEDSPQDSANDDDDYKDDYSDEFSVDDYISDDDLPSYKLQISNYSKDDRTIEVPYSEGTSLHEHLEYQLGLQKIDERQKMLAKYILGNIDESGYLRREIESIADDLAFSANIMATDDELRDLLKIIQKFDPPGVGAFDLQESLLLQIDRKKEDFPEHRKELQVTYDILKNHFDEFSKKHYSKIIQRMGITEENLKKAVEFIIKLSPKPGAMFSNPMNRTSQHITPDFLLETVDGELLVSINSGTAPDLRISQTYADMLKGYQDNNAKATRNEKDTITFVKQKLDSAKWFIDAIKQRQNTLLMTMRSIVDYQEEYFKNGDETKLRPMILKDIADRTQLDISTISRVANSKYIQTHFGIFPLKYFFSEGMETQDGETVSTREIKQILQECIDNEEKRKPLTDERLAQILQEKGYRIARRTVAKYREQLGILVARLRKEL